MLRYVIRILLIVIILSAVFAVVPVPAYGLGEIELALSGQGSTSMALQNITPGDSGSASVDLRNNGFSNGWVIIWVSNISSTEGVNPESESGNTAEPGELINYLLFNCAADGLETNIALPVTIDNLPQTATDTDYIRLPLNSLETVSLTWDWQFTDNGQPQNDAQGDGVSFDFNYLLTNETPTDTSDTANTAYYYSSSPPTASQQLDVDVLGEESSVGIDGTGKLTQSMVVTSPDYIVQLELEQGTVVTDSDGSAITKLEMRTIDNPVPPPDGMKIVGGAYEIIGYTEDSVIASVVFDRPVGLKLSYHPNWLPEEESSLYIATLDDKGNWQKSGGMFVANQPRVISTIVNGSSVFAIMAYLFPGEEADVLTPIASDPGEAEPVQKMTGGSGRSSPSGTMTAPSQTGPKVRYTISNAAVIEKSRRISIWVMAAGSAVLIILIWFERRRKIHGTYA